MFFFSFISVLLVQRLNLITKPTFYESRPLWMQLCCVLIDKGQTVFEMISQLSNLLNERSLVLNMFNV